MRVAGGKKQPLGSVAFRQFSRDLRCTRNDLMRGGTDRFGARGRWTSRNWAHGIAFARSTWNWRGRSVAFQQNRRKRDRLADPGALGSWNRDGRGRSGGGNVRFAGGRDWNSRRFCAGRRQGRWRLRLCHACGQRLARFGFARRNRLSGCLLPRFGSSLCLAFAQCSCFGSGLSRNLLLGFYSRHCIGIRLATGQERSIDRTLNAATVSPSNSLLQRKTGRLKGRRSSNSFNYTCAWSKPGYDRNCNYDRMRPSQARRRGEVGKPSGSLIPRPARQGCP